VNFCSVPLFDWTGNKSINLSNSKDRVRPAQKHCGGAAEVLLSVAKQDLNEAGAVLLRGAYPSYPSATFNPPLHAVSKSQTSTSSNVQDLELDSPQRWTAKRKAALIIDILQGKTTAAEAARHHALTLAEVEQWKDDFITQGTEALRSHPRDLAQHFEPREKTLLAKVGELTLHVDILKKAHRYQGKDLPDGISW